MTNPHIILVPGFWLGAWAWDEVTPVLQESGHEVTALTLPGLESVESESSQVTMEDHIAAIVEAVEAAGAPVVLAVHSGAGFPGYAATDRVPEKIVAAVYVDTGPGMGAMDPEFADDAYPLPAAEQLAEQENLDGLTEAHLASFRERAVPQPGAALREAVELHNEARLDIPTTVICTSFSADEYREAVAAGYGFVKGLSELRDVTYVEMPTSHWPMWSRPDDLADLIAQVADRAATR